MPTTPIQEYADSDGRYGRGSVTQYAEFDGIKLELGFFLGPLTVAMRDVLLFHPSETMRF